MGKRDIPNWAETMRVMRLLTEVALVRDNPAGQRQLFVDGLAKLTYTDTGFFYTADHWFDERPSRFSEITLTTQRDEAFLKYTTEFGVNFPLDDDPYCFHSRRNPATLQTYTGREIIPDEATAVRHTHFMDLRDTGRLRDGVVSLYRDDRTVGRIVGVGLHRLGRGRDMSVREARLTSLAVGELRRMERAGMVAIHSTRTVVEHGRPVRGARVTVDTLGQLPPQMRRVLEALLRGDTPKRIARDLSLSIHTVREHVQRLYRQFGVHGRDELMAKFIIKQ